MVILTGLLIIEEPEIHKITQVKLFLKKGWATFPPKLNKPAKLSGKVARPFTSFLFLALPGELSFYWAGFPLFLACAFIFCGFLAQPFFLPTFINYIPYLFSQKEE